MRGGGFHEHLADGVEADLQAAGFTVYREHLRRLPDGRANFIDLLGVRGPLELGVEIETTPRNAAGNAAMALVLNLPLLVIVPSRSVLQAVIDRIERRCGRTDGRIWILLPDAVARVLTDCFPAVPDGD